MEEKLKKIVKPLINWYKKNARDLPWRKEVDSYHVWISEIMLQQTRIEVAIQYYERFIKEIPNISELANIEEEKLLKLWEGLGYYNRARNLKKAAQTIVGKYHGEMPKTYDELLELPGIGKYTAGAIASIAYQERVPAVDGNVLRVISRVLASRKNILLNTTKKEITGKLKAIIPEQAGNFNQALMELGEQICIPNGIPNCNECPLKEICLTNKKELTQEIPIRKKETNRRKEEKTILLFRYKGKIAIQKREEKGLLSGMYEFPNVGKKLREEEINILLQEWKMGGNITELNSCIHIFSHIEWHMIGYQIKVNDINTKFLWVTPQELLNKYPMPTAFLKYAKQLK